MKSRKTGLPNMHSLPRCQDSPRPLCRSTGWSREHILPESNCPRVYKDFHLRKDPIGEPLCNPVRGHNHPGCTGCRHRSSRHPSCPCSQSPGRSPPSCTHCHRCRVWSYSRTHIRFGASNCPSCRSSRHRKQGKSPVPDRGQRDIFSYGAKATIVAWDLEMNNDTPYIGTAVFRCAGVVIVARDFHLPCPANTILTGVSHRTYISIITGGCVR